MTAGQYCKSQGTTLKVVSDITRVSRQTLLNWHRDKNELFKIVVIGVVRGIRFKYRL